MAVMINSKYIWWRNSLIICNLHHMSSSNIKHISKFLEITATLQIITIIINYLTALLCIGVGGVENDNFSMMF